MKKLWILLLATALSLPSIAQNKPTNFTGDLKSKGYTEVEWTYIKKMMAAAKALDACSRQANQCNLTDPVKNKQASALEQIPLGFSFGVEREVVVQKRMAGFEKAISEDKKNRHLPWIDVLSAFERHPGYSYKAMAGRMTIYIKELESQDK